MCLDATKCSGRILSSFLINLTLLFFRLKFNFFQCLLPSQTTTAPVIQDYEVCDPLDEENGYWKCSDDNKKGSKCSLLCFAGYEQQRTKKRCKCKGERCFWKGPNRSCVPNQEFSTAAPAFEQVCEAIEPDDFGTWNCSNENQVNSKCDLKCQKGYRVNAFGNARRCRCSAKRKECSWTR